ncbi:putative glycosyltransferase family 28 domain-containing protein [Phaeoacremonium minimum UCRPA7]|uniref:Putative glycosyltransferase family 28 domain-containing protein n=1 Tax=Phaeoacremonium minimum (strain UCR-PA7) TaxID=1286976 RepID=R8BN31_PHAM7|nr:putative glycosyltransferase family 28 domain-containing protein [Phaeoacremonium minimum UCRPA7]EOO00695.1 putative glycosyltransferase family 28 domain-containing protein [Phaeoacremonium minimum UCRPA7]
MDTAIAAGKGVSRIVGTGVKTPMNFCLGAARGFRNAPRLYNDDTVRPTEKVTDFASGLRVAGKEFGYGIFDGISGLVTQPIRGAEKEGPVGFVKGFGKGLGGFFFKNSAAIWSIPAYAMQGVHAEIRNLFTKSIQNYIFTSRVLQGEEDFSSSSREEQEDIILRWNAKKDDLKGYYNLKQKEKKGESPPSSERGPSDTPPKTGWFHTRHLSWDERKKLQAQKEEWRKKRGTASTPSVDRIWEDDELERAIRESVQQTSRGNSEEDAMIEAQIRASVAEMRRAADQSRELQDVKQPVPEASSVLAPPEDITDEEYQALVEEAIRQSLAHQAIGPPPPLPPRANSGLDDEEALRRAIEESRRQQSEPHHGDDDEEELRRALEESERAHREQEARSSSAKTEEEIIMEYVKRQSLAEEEYRRQKAKGKAVRPSGTDDNDDDDEVDEDLKRALEESLKVSGRDGAGPSSSGA